MPPLHGRTVARPPAVALASVLRHVQEKRPPVLYTEGQTGASRELTLEVQAFSL